MIMRIIFDLLTLVLGVAIWLVLASCPPAEARQQPGCVERPGDWPAVRCG